MTSQSRRERDAIAQRAQAVMHRGLAGTFFLDDETTIHGRVDKMSLNGVPDPKRPHDPVTVTIRGQHVALGRIVKVHGGH